MTTRTKRQISAGQVRRLRTMRQQLLDMAADWDDVDQFNLNRVTEVADAVEALAVDMQGEDL